MAAQEVVALEIHLHMEAKAMAENHILAVIIRQVEGVADILQP